jgi:hypothetical protein
VTGPSPRFEGYAGQQSGQDATRPESQAAPPHILNLPKRYSPLSHISVVRRLRPVAGLIRPCWGKHAIWWSTDAQGDAGHEEAASYVAASQEALVKHKIHRGSGPRGFRRWERRPERGGLAIFVRFNFRGQACQSGPTRQSAPTTWADLSPLRGQICQDLGRH